jgi:major intracellular serine protease
MERPELEKIEEFKFDDSLANKLAIEQLETAMLEVEECGMDEELALEAEIDPLHTKDISAMLGTKREFIPCKTTGRGIKIGVVDTGIDERHPALAGRVVRKHWYRYDGTPTDHVFNGNAYHGTHVAGTILGVAPGAILYDYRVFGSNGTLSTSKAILSAVIRAVKDGCDIINMSLGSVSLNPTHNPYGYLIYKYAASKGVMIVVAAGNGADGNPRTDEASYPASYPTSISVGAVQVRKLDFEKNELLLGIPRFSRSHPSVDVVCPGVKIKSTFPNGRYGRISGTSMAAPHASGFIALLLERFRRRFLTSNVKETIKYITKDIYWKGHDFQTGDGFLTFLPFEPTL